MKLLWRAALVVLAGGAVFAACSSRAATTPPAGAMSAPGYHPGKFVWHDLVTRNPASARRFYGALLGWEFQDTTRNGRPYAVARVAGKPVAGIVVHPDSTEENALWLSYLSVLNVDQAVEQVSAAGATVLYPPTDLPGAARVAVIADPQGAPLGLARLTDGDPADGPAPIRGHIFWMEYIAGDADAALEFYRDLSGYETTVQKGEAGGDYHVLRRDGRSRAGLFQIPKDADENVDPNWLPYVRVDDPAALAGQVEALGGQVILAPQARVREGTLAIIADPTGGTLALQKWPL
jgi:predicted enzyme related to lactoylglutathione lyase